MDPDQLFTYLTTLEPDAEHHEFLWAGLHDSLPPIQAYGTPLEMLPKLGERNAQGYGIFVAVNAIDIPAYGPKGQAHRRAVDVTRVRAVFADVDDPNAVLPDYPLQPTMIVETSPGKWHIYWCVESDFPLDQFERAQRGIAQVMGTDKSVIDLPRVLRIPGFDHTKDMRNRHKVELLECHPHRRYGADEILGAFPYDGTVSAAPAARLPQKPWFLQLGDIATQTAGIVSLRHQQRPDGGYNVPCPWQHEHTTGSAPSGTTYWPPSEQNAGRGSFVCFHSHCQGRMVDEFDAYVAAQVHL